MAHTVKDISGAQTSSAWDKYYAQEKLSEQELAYVRRYTRRKSQRRKHARLMRTYKASICGDRKCCGSMNVESARAQEKREWKREVLLSL
jgi:hypothetical protein